MLSSEKGLVRAIKRAYKNSGYVVMNTGDAVAIYTENWFVLANRALPMAGSLAVNTLLIAVFVVYLVRHDFPLSSLPVVGKYFKK